MVRPQLFSILAFSATLSVTERVEDHRWRPRLAPLAVIFAVWANLHGGFLVGLFLLGLTAARELLLRRTSFRDAIGVCLVATCATLCTPYGLGLWRFLAETVRLGRADIADWAPVWNDWSSSLPMTLVLLVVVVALIRGRTRALVSLAPALALGALAARVLRLECFVALAATVEAAPFFKGLGDHSLQLSSPARRREIIVAVSLVAAFAVAAGWLVWPGLTCLTEDFVWRTGRHAATRWQPDPEAVTFIKENALRGRLISWFDYGQYALWHLSPELRVSYDGRRETLYSQDVQAAHDRLYFDGATDDARLMVADYAWLPNALPAVRALQARGWHLAFRGTRSTVLAREDRAFVQPAAYTGPRCFPGP